MPGLWSATIALTAGVVVAGMLLATSLRAEFPLFSEASAERGRDCTTIASARHALDATLQSRLPLRAGDAEAARAVGSAVAAFNARTQDLATPAVEAGLAEVRGRLAVLAQRVQAPASAPKAVPGVDDALADLRDAWTGPIGRVCS